MDAVLALRTTDAKEAFARQFPVHVGVDVGKSFHQLVARDSTGARGPAVRIDATRAGFESAEAALRGRFPLARPAEMLVGLEFAGHYGATFAQYLTKRGYGVVTVLPAVTKRTKELEDNSPRKDDSKDAGQICKLLGQGLFVGAPVLPDALQALRVLTTERQRLAREETGLVNRLHAALDLAWPEFPTAFPRLQKPTPQALLHRWPTAESFAHACLSTIQRVVHRASRGHVSAARARALHQAARESVALHGATLVRAREIRRCLARYDVARAQITEVEGELGRLVAGIPAAQALLTVPRVSVVCAATIVAELGLPASFRHPRQMLKLAGMNLAARSSGTSLHGRPHQTKRGRPALRRQLFLLAGRWCQRGGPARGRYAALLARNGGRRASAVCAVARSLVPPLLRVMQSGAPFDLARWSHWA